MTGTPCSYADCPEVIPLRVEWHPFGDGSQGTWTSVRDDRALTDHIAKVHAPKPERAVQ